MTAEGGGRALPVPTPRDLVGKRALVCGASRGIGRACAMALAQAGAELTLMARHGEALDATADDMRRSHPGARVTPVVGDLSDPDGCAEVLPVCAEADILVLLLPRLVERPPRDVRSADVQDGLAAGVVGPLRLVLAAVNGMYGREFGRVVSILGSSTKAPLPSHIVSNMARTAYAAAMASLARDAARHNVAINNVLPGPTETEGLHATWQARARRNGVSLNTLRDAALSRIPAGRLGRPQEIAALCAFLCSRDAGYLTGQNIVVDGGAFPGLF